MVSAETISEALYHQLSLSLSILQCCSQCHYGKLEALFPSFLSLVWGQSLGTRVAAHGTYTLFDSSVSLSFTDFCWMCLKGE